MASQNPRRPKGCVYFQSYSAPEMSCFLTKVLVTDTTHHIGEDHCIRYEEIYIIFNSGDFPAEDENIGIYQNIRKRNIHLLVA
jgi:hypothetical protein